MTGNLWIDILLCLCVLFIAASIFLVKNTFSAIVLFISLGLVVTFCWIILNAIDVAIAEAAIGSGLTGAMLVAAWRKLSSDNSKNQHRKDKEKSE
jgi:uncharacterized MnhB-related membrane protein